MRRCNPIIGLMLLVSLPLATNPLVGNPISQTAVMSPGAPCTIELPRIYLVIDRIRRHIRDWETFLALGYTPADIVPCGDAAAYAEGGPITRLLRGSSEKVYWMEKGLRRYIPDEDTFTAMGFQVKNVTVVPDYVLDWWPLGDPLQSTSLTPQVARQVTIGAYTVRVWRHTRGLFDYATISTPNQPDVKIDAVDSIGALPVPDVTGQGNPDVMFLIRSVGSSHCCWGMIVYELGKTPRQILALVSTPYFGPNTGRGEFKDLDGDGVYELTTSDALDGPCSQQTVEVVLRYDTGLHRYIGASPRYASIYAPLLAQLSVAAENATDKRCAAVPLAAQLLYLGRGGEARTAFYSLYQANDADAIWIRLQEAVHHGRYYTPAN